MELGVVPSKGQMLQKLKQYQSFVILARLWSLERMQTVAPLPRWKLLMTLPLAAMMEQQFGTNG